MVDANGNFIPDFGVIEICLVFIYLFIIFLISSYIKNNYLKSIYDPCLQKKSVGRKYG